MLGRTWVGMWVGVFAVGAMLFVALPALCQEQEPEPPLLTVRAEADVEAEPDVAKISLGVQALRPTPKEAAAKVTQTVDAVKAKLADLGVGKDEVETSELYLGQGVEYDPRTGRAVRKGYQAYHWLRVTLKNEDFDKLAAVVDAAVAAGATSLSGLVFEVEDDNALRAQALAKAVGYAKEKAQAMAAAAGVEIVGVQRITEQYPEAWPYGYAAEAAAPAAGAMAPAEAGFGAGEMPAEAIPSEPMVPGKLRITCEVEVQFRLQ